MTVTLAAANSYFQVHIAPSAWTNATDEQKTAALGTAESEILNLPLRLETPLTNKLEAIYEQAAFELSAGDRRAELQAQGVKSVSISGGVSESYTGLPFGFALAPRAKVKLIGWWVLGVI